MLLTFTRMLLMKTRVLSLPNSIRLFSFLILFFQIVMELPRRFRGAEPQLLYSTQKHGISQRTFFHKAKNYPFTLLVIKDTKGHVRKQMAVLREKKEKKKKSEETAKEISCLCSVCRFLVGLRQSYGKSHRRSFTAPEKVFSSPSDQPCRQAIVSSISVLRFLSQKLYNFADFQVESFE